MTEPDEDHGGSNVCFLADLVGGHVVDPETHRALTRFRKAERTRLYDLRKQMSQSDARAQAAKVAAGLDRLLPDIRGAVIAAYWPIRGELDLRFWMAALQERGAHVALPVVIEKGQPLEFHRWTPEAAMKRGIWNILVPALADPLAPDIVVAPLLGVDDANYRLGNGGGYYDMTLAALAAKPLVIGVGQEFCRLPTIFPQPWDIRMDHVILGQVSPP